MFASKSAAVHLLRGAFGGTALICAFTWTDLGWPVLLLLPVALFCFRGCPGCWLIGLIETLQQGASRQRGSAPCRGGDCVQPTKRPVR
jgi:hypothetical protein